MISVLIYLAVVIAGSALFVFVLWHAIIKQEL